MEYLNDGNLMPGDRVLVYDRQRFVNDVLTPYWMCSRPGTVVCRYGMRAKHTGYKYEDLVDVKFDQGVFISKAHFTHYVHRLRGWWEQSGEFEWTYWADCKINDRAFSTIRTKLGSVKRKNDLRWTWIVVPNERRTDWLANYAQGTEEDLLTAIKMVEKGWNDRFQKSTNGCHAESTV